MNSYPPYNPADTELAGMFSWDDKKKKVKPDPILFCIQAESRFFPVTFKRKLYLFDHDTGLYYEETGTIRQWVQKQVRRMIVLLKEGRIELLDGKNCADYTIQAAQRLEPIIRDVEYQMACCNVIEGNRFPFNQYDGFSVHNGVIVFDRGSGCFSLKECTHLMKFTRKIPVDYNPGADTDKVIEVLKQWLPDDDYRWLIQIAAQAVIQSLPGYSPFKQSYLLLGDPNSGKSSYGNLLLKLVGETNFATHMLHELDDNFIVATLPYRMFCFGDDLPFIKIDAGNKLKTLTGKKSIMVNPKYCMPYETEITAVFVFSANYAPQLVQALVDDNGWWDRWTILRFSGRFQKDPKWEERTITKEFLEGFLLLVLFEVQLILDSNGRMRLRQDPEDVKEVWVSDAQMFHDYFFSQYIDITTDDLHWISKDDMYISVTTWIEGRYFTNDTSLTDEQFIERMPKTKPAITEALAREGVLPKAVRAEGVSRPYFNVKWNSTALICGWCHHDHSR